VPDATFSITAARQVSTHVMSRTFPKLTEIGVYPGMSSGNLDHHHKFECGIPGALNDLTRTEGDLMDAVLAAHAWDFHCLLCLLLLDANGQISPNEWAGVRSLHRRLVFAEKSPYTMDEILVLCFVVLEIFSIPSRFLLKRQFPPTSNCLVSATFHSVISKAK
jgi:hypothetical protein